ncbi:MAG: MipA/OmpV family protein [Pseudomonadota bacterium]
MPGHVAAMRQTQLLLALVLTALFAFADGASAADESTLVDAPDAVEAREIVFDVGLGARLQPVFPSSQKYEVVPMPLFGMHFLRLPFFGEVVDNDRKPSVFSIYPSFAFVGERDDVDASYLAGIPDVDSAIELGAGVALRYRFVRAFAQVRYGVTGHSGFVGEGGIQLIHKFLDDRLTLSGGPRVSLASEDYMDTYFTVGPGATVLPQYTANAGFKDVGVGLQAVYELTERVRVVGHATYTHFVGEAGDSPIVAAGNKDELRIGVGLTYRLGFDLY